MRIYLCIFAFVVPVLLFAQNDEDPCLSFQRMYEQKVVEAHTLRGEVERLRNDSMQCSNMLINALQEQLLQMRTLLNNCREDSMLMQKQLTKCNKESIQKSEDSIQSLNTYIAVLKDSLVFATKELKVQDKEMAKLTAVVDYLDAQFARKSVDELYGTADRGKLNLCVDIYGKLGKELPKNIRLTLACFAAEELVTRKYDKIRIEKSIAALPQNTETGKTIAQRLQNYATVNVAANKLWASIKSEVCYEEFPNDDFTQIQKKRQIWQRTQKFLNQYPTLATDYPYIFDQLQSMLRQIWNNANNFREIKNPFE